MNIWMEIIGWTGAFMVLGAYFLLSFKKLAGDSYRYQCLNIVGSIFLVIYGCWKQASASVMVNVVWCAIGLAAVWSLMRAARK